MVLSESMSTPVRKTNGKIVRHPFGGCEVLRAHYACVGSALLKYEKTSQVEEAEAAKELRVGISFVPVEVLESYLDDLLDSDVTEERLSIARRNVSLKNYSIALIGLCLAVAAGLSLASTGASLLFSFSITLLLGLPFAVIWHYSPRCRLKRRMNFAQLLSVEIGRRRGINKNGPFSDGRRQIWENLWGDKEVYPYEGAA